MFKVSDSPHCCINTNTKLDVVTDVDYYAPQRNDSIFDLHAEYKRANCFVENFQCCFSCCWPGSTPSSPPTPPADSGLELQPWYCNGQVPTLEELKQVVIDTGVAGVQTDVFVSAQLATRTRDTYWG